MNLQEIFNQKQSNLKEVLRREIKSQQEHLNSRKETLLNTMLDICQSRYSTREQFTYISSCEYTLNSMLTMYREMFNEDYVADVPPVVIAEDLFGA